MAKITEQAIAEIEINDKKAADSLRNLQSHAASLREQLKNISADDQEGFANLTKQINLVEKEMKGVFAQAVNVEKVLKDLNGTSFNTLQRAQRALINQFKAGKISAEEYAEKIGPINEKLEELNNIVHTGSVEQKSGWSSVIGVVGKFAAGIGIAKLAVDGYNRVMQSTNDLADKFEIYQAQAKAAVDSFFRSIGSGDWGNLIANMRIAINAAREYTEVMDELGDRKISMDVETSQLKTLEAQQKIIMRDQTKSDEDRISAAEKIEEIESRILDMRKGDLKKALEAELDFASKQNGVSKEFLADMVESYHHREDDLKIAKEILKLEEDIKNTRKAIRTAGNNQIVAQAESKHLGELYDKLNLVKDANKDLTYTLNTGTKLSLEQLVDQWRLYGNVIDESRVKIGQAMVAVEQQQTEYYTATARSESMASGLKKQIAQEDANARKTAYADALKVLEKHNAERRLAITTDRENGKITDAIYNMQMLEAEMNFLNEKIKLQKAYGEESVNTEIERARKIIDEARKNAEILKQLQSASDTDFDTSKITADSEKLFQQIIADADKQLNAEIERTQNFLDEETDLRMESYQEWAAMREQLGMVGMEEQYLNEKRRLDEIHAEGIISEEEYQQALLSIKLQYLQEYAEKSKFFSQTLQNVVGGLEDLALQKSKNRKDKELAAAGDNAEERAAIEEKYAQEELDIQKRYADANFILQTSQIIASTAVAAINAYSAMASIPLVGPALGVIAAGAAIAAGAIQIAQAKAARDAAKQATLGSSTGGGGSKITSAGGYKTGGFTGDGPSDEPAGTVHRGEYVVPKVVMSNPAAMNHVRVLEAMRQSHYPNRRRYPGFLEGGYTDTGVTGSDSGMENNTDNAVTKEQLMINQQLLSLLDRLDKEGVKMSYERMQKSKASADSVIYRATRR